MALFKIMKTKWIEVMIIVMALGLLSFCFAAWDNTRPGAADPVTDWPGLITANWDALEIVMGVNLVGVHPYYQSATPLKKPDASTNLDADDLGRIWIDSDDERMYVFAAVTPTWTSYPSLTLTNTWDAVQTLADSSQLATSAAPTADAEITNKKYVDDQDTADHPAYTGGESYTDGSGRITKSGYSVTDGTTTITFEDEFPNDIISVIVTIAYNSSPNDGIAVNTVDKTKFDIETNNSYTGFYWIAIGY